MKGCELRHLRQYELAMFQAWQTARLSNYEAKLEPLAHYLKELRPEPARRQTPEEMLYALRAVKASMAGAN